MGLVDLPEISDYFLDDFCACHIIRQTVTLQRLKKFGQYIHRSDDKDRESRR
jgi:hypothetical protein